MTEIVKFFVLLYSYKKGKGAKTMTKFDEYVERLQEAKTAKHRNKINGLMQKLLKEQSQSQTLALLKTVLAGGQVTLLKDEKEKVVLL